MRWLVLAPLGTLLAYFAGCFLILLSLNVVNVPLTGVQVQRQLEALGEDEAYDRVYQPVAGSELSPHLKHALVAAEDGRFYEHGGIDWEAVREAAEDGRGGSTISQQLVKNLFLSTHRSWVRKALEVPLTYLAELALPKERLLEVYLNVIEWDRGVYGAEAAAQHHLGTSAASLSRSQAATLAAIVPAPRSRTPQNTGWYRSIILRRMSQMGW